MNRPAYREALQLLAAPSSPLVQVDWPAADAAGVKLYMKRDELLDEHVSGNKWRKLLLQLAWHLRRGALGFASVGGRHSNHLVALAALCARLQVECNGYVRGGVGEQLSPSLAFAKTHGMTLLDALRKDVRLWRESRSGPVLSEKHMWIPEGGTSALGMAGMAACVREIRNQLGAEPDAYVVAAGSGGTAAGIARKAHAPVHAMQVVKDDGLPARTKQPKICWHRAWLSGFASGEPLIYQMMLEFRARNGIQLDPVYTSKALIQLDELLCGGEFAPGSKLVFVHTGGLQGLAPWMQRYGYS